MSMSECLNMEKQAGITDKLVQMLKSPKFWAMGGVGSITDYNMYSQNTPNKIDDFTSWIPYIGPLLNGLFDSKSPGRLPIAAANAATPAVGGKQVPIMTVAGDALLNAAYVFQGEGKQRLDTAKAQESAANAQKYLTMLGVGAGALALAGGGYAFYKWLQDRETERRERTRMKMKISTPDGKDAIVDLPINNPELSSKLSDEFNRGVTRTVRRTARYNSMKLDPETNKYIPFPDWHKKYGNGQGITTYTGQATGETGDEYTQKAANLTNMPAYNLVDKYPEPAKGSGYDLTKSDKVRRFLDALDIPQERLDKMASALAAKQSGSLGEIFGTVASPILTGTAAGIAANKLFDVPTNQSLMIGAGAAGLSSLLGAAAAGIAPSRTQTEQEQHDMTGHSLLNILMPGAAMFNAVQRAKALPEQPDVPSIPTISQPTDQVYQKPIVENKPLQQSDDFFDEEDDI